jgi:hypothetical protein
MFVCRTQEEVHEEEQQTITVEVEVKRHDSEPTITAPQPSPETRYTASALLYIDQDVSHKALKSLAQLY